jgi:hypothetical protein
MKPIALYQGGAPATFSQMGQGVAEGIGRVGELYGAGISAIGKEISKGIDAVFEYKQITDSANALKKAVKSLPDDDYGSKSFMLSFLEDPRVSDLQKTKMGSELLSGAFRNLLDLRRIQETNKGRLDVAGMRAGAGGGGTTGGLISSFAPTKNPQQ